jgi:hypothetical protein
VKRFAILALLLLCAAPVFAIKVSLANVAAATTIAVNADSIVKAVRHPKATAKATGKKIKAAVKGK